MPENPTLQRDLLVIKFHVYVLVALAVKDLVSWSVVLPKNQIWDTPGE